MNNFIENHTGMYISYCPETRKTFLVPISKRVRKITPKSNQPFLLWYETLKYNFIKMHQIYSKLLDNENPTSVDDKDMAIPLYNLKYFCCCIKSEHSATRIPQETWDALRCNESVSLTASLVPYVVCSIN